MGWSARDRRRTPDEVHDLGPGGPHSTTTPAPGRTFSPPADGSAGGGGTLARSASEPTPAQRSPTTDVAPDDATVVRRTPSPGAPVIRRVMDPVEFGTSTDMGFTDNQGNAHRKQIQGLLGEYRNITMAGGGGVPDAQVDKALRLAQAMATTAEGYLKSVGPTRDRAGFEALLTKARAQVAELKQRQTAQAAMPPKQPDKAAPTTAMPTKHVSGDPNRLFKKVGQAVGLVAPKPGDKGTFSIELSVPTPTAGVNAKGNMVVSAERGEKTWKARARIMLGAGVGVAGFAELSAAIGGYLEAEAGDVTGLGALLERALYDRVSSSPLPNIVVEYLFGNGGAAGAPTAAERMTAIGDQHLNEGSYYESGVELESSLGAEGAASATGGFTWGTRRDSAKGPAKGAMGLSRAFKMEKPFEAELQLQGKVAGPLSNPKLVSGDLSIDFVLDQAMLMKLQKSADVAAVSTVIFAALEKAVAVLASTGGSDKSSTGATAAQLVASLGAAHATMIAKLIELKQGLPPAAAPGVENQKGLSAKSAIGMGIKADVVEQKTSVSIRHIMELELNVGQVGAKTKVKGTRSTEASMDVLGGKPPTK